MLERDVAWTGRCLAALAFHAWNALVQDALRRLQLSVFEAQARKLASEQLAAAHMLAAARFQDSARAECRAAFHAWAASGSAGDA